MTLEQAYKSCKQCYAIVSQTNGNPAEDDLRHQLAAINALGDEAQRLKGKLTNALENEALRLIDKLAGKRPSRNVKRLPSKEPTNLIEVTDLSRCGYLAGKACADCNYDSPRIVEILEENMPEVFGKKTSGEVPK